MKRLRLFILVFVAGLGMSGCSNFLKESSQDEVIPETVYDYSELVLNYMGYSDIGQMLFVLSDETQLRSDVFDWGDDYSYSMEVEGVFTWQPDMWETETMINSAYADAYALIMGVNAVLDGIDGARGDQETRDRVKAEALGLRGFYYFFLVNLFGEPYNYNKEALGVPLKLTAALVENGMKRNTVGEVYEQIVEDLETSSELFNQLPKTRGDYRINSTTVDIILSRVYLFMERYDDAVTAASRAIESAEGLTDYTKLAEKGGFTMYSYDNSEVEWVYGDAGEVYDGIILAPSSSLMDCFTGKSDRREIFWFCTYDEYEDEIVYEEAICKISNYGTTPTNTIRISEAYLNRAEAYVLSEQANKNTLALADLNELRRNRIVDYEDVNITDEAQLLDEIRTERYAELCFEGHRWFDLRRYGMPAITHDYKQYGKDAWMTYTLQEKDPLYTLPIPSEAIKNNIQLEQNASAYEPKRVGELKD